MNKGYIKKALCIFTVTAFLLPGVLSFAEGEDAENEVLHIKSEEEFAAFAENCSLDSYSEGLSVCLDADLNFEGKTLRTVPYFNGSFDGLGHKISGFSLETDGSNKGLFRFIEKDGTVTDLTVEGNITAENSSSETGGIAAVNRGSISNCRFNGSVNGTEHTGGIAGRNEGLISGCRSEGLICGRRCTGGIAGYSTGTIEDCLNEASVNTIVNEGGIDLDGIDMTGSILGLNLVSADAGDIVSDSGGICGLNESVIVRCTNNGAAGYPHYGYNVGGIAGRQCGYVHECVNTAAINGRKDVGGIVGQMEPFLTVKNKRQLQDATNALTGSISSAISNSSMYSDEVNEALERLQGTARLVADNFTVNEQGIITVVEGADWSITETVKADLLDNLSVLTYVKEDMSDTLAADLYTVNANASALMELLSNAMSGNLSLVDYKDISGESVDVETDIEGKVSACSNIGAVEGDISIGGISGAMEVENENDMEGSLSGIVKNTLDLQGINSVTYNAKCSCTSNINEGNVLCRKDSAGGIVGTESIGIISGCENYADVSTDGRFCGGIAGTASAKITDCCSKGSVSAAEYAGGIAGTASSVTHCRAIVNLENAKGCRGAIAGFMEYEENSDILGNIFIYNGTGAIDNISYTGYSEPVTEEEFMASENLPERMKEEKKEESSAEEEESATKGVNSIVSAQMAEDGQNPYALATGVFPKDARIIISDYEYAPADENDRPCLAQQIKVDKGKAETFKIYYPKVEKNEKLTVFVLTGDGWQEAEQESNPGSYFTVPAYGNMATVLAYKTESYAMMIGLACIGAAIAAAAVCVIINKRRKKRETIDVHR